MTKPVRSKLRVCDLFDLESQLAADESLDLEALRQRDRAIGMRIAVLAQDRRALFLAWLHRVREPDAVLPGQRAAQARSAAGFLLALLGFALGLVTVMGIFAFEGQHPVNVVHVLGIFVGFQLLLLLLAVISVLPSSWILALPCLETFQESLRMLSPGRLLAPASRLLPVEARTGLAQALGRLRQFERCYTRVRTWLAIEASQVLAVAFHLGAVLSTLALVTFTDVSFGWSTTLEVAATGFHRVTHWLAFPWASLLPDAVPSLELIEATRYFRLESSFASDSMDLGASGQWWPFVVLCMLCYGLLPRLTLWALASWRLRATLNQLPLHHVGFARLYERLTEPLVETRSDQPASERNSDVGSALRRDASAPSNRASTYPAHQQPAMVLDWGGVDIPEEELRKALAERFHLEVQDPLPVGRLDLADDEHALEALAAQPELPVVLLTKSYEAPTRDLMRFLRALRAHMGDSRMIYLLPMERDMAGRPAPARGEDLEQWRRRAASLGDPWLRVEGLGEDP